MVDTAWDLDGYFKIDVKPDGAYLSVYAPIGDGEPVEISNVLAELTARGIEGFDEDLIRQTIKEGQGASIKIVERQVGEEAAVAEDLFVVEISEDEMSAYLTVFSFAEESPAVIENIHSALEAHGVVHGIDEERITTLLKEKEFNKPILVARGTPAIPGQDAVINFKFRKDTDKRGPKIEADGRVNFRKLDLVENVTVGQVIANKLTPTKGIPGKTITGREIKAPDGEDLSLPAGKNTEISSDSLKLIATVSGRVIWTGTRIDVEPIYDIKGDINFTTGDIDFVGSVIVGGNITDGFTVKATGNIEVKGCIEGANVTAGGNIIVQNGILGRDEGRVFAEGDIIAKFIQNGNIEAMRDVLIQDAIIHSRVDAGERVVIVGGKRGVLIGGKVRAGREVNIRTVGSWREVPTEIEVGVAPRTREKVLVLEREIEEDKKKFRDLKLGIKTLLLQKEQMGGLPPAKEELLNKHLRAQNMFMRKLRDTMTRINLLQKELAVDVGGKVSIFNVIYPGVKISIRRNTMHVREEYKFVTFFGRGNKIEFKEYEEPKITKKDKK